MIRLDQLPWLLWRLVRNSICAFPPTKKILFPSNKLSAQFGPSDGAYGRQVFCVHFERLRKAGFSCADSILEVGSGRNIGTSLLWYSMAMDGRHGSVRVALWDVISNVDIDADAWSDCADCSGPNPSMLCCQREPQQFFRESQQAV
jgi:hypothetical protein